jgi:murein DD-endopeptidase MepM/ murein hydrolase activator NlpD
LTGLTPPLAGARHGLVEGLLGGGLALVAITIAHAALPDPSLPIAKAAPPKPVAQKAVAEALAATPVLIAFHEPLPDGEVGSPFGLRQLPWEEHARLHAGVDIVTPAPEPVLAAADGVVSRIGEDPGYGRFVELTHAEGLTTRYGHLQRFAPGLAVGQAVKGGTAVGQEGSTGSSTGAHLHFEVHDADGHPMNPELFLGHAFASAADLPLKAGRKIPRAVRVAYVSRIPRNKQAQMEAKLEGEAAAEAGDAGASTDEGPRIITVHRRHGRVHARLRL